MKTINTFKGRNQFGSSTNQVDLRDYDDLYFKLFGKNVNILDLESSWENYFKKNSIINTKKLEIIEEFVLFFNNYKNSIPNINEYNHYTEFYQNISNIISDFLVFLETENNSITSKNIKPFYFELKSKKIIIETLQKSFSWNIYLQVLSYLYYNNKLPQSNDPFILETILKTTKLNNKVL